MFDSPSSRAANSRAATSHAGAARDRRQGGLRALGGSLGPVTKRAFARRGLTGADIARQWAAIIGGELAAQCRPRQLRFPKRGEAVDGSLTLRVAPGWALQLQHLEPLVLERINGFFGYRAVARLVLQQGPLPAPSPGSLGRASPGAFGGAADRRSRAAAAAPGPLDASLAAKLSTVADPELRAALEGLGRSLGERRRAGGEKP